MRRHYFYAGMAAAYLSGVAAFYAGLWWFDAGKGRHPVRKVREWFEEDSIDVT